MDDFLVDRVLLAVEQIPPGRVASYGDLGRLTGASPRRVGTIMKLYSRDVPYWRVVGAAGDPGGRLLDQFRPRWVAEGITVKANGRGCRMDDFHADLGALEQAYRQALDALLATSSTPLPAIGASATRGLAGIGVTTLEGVIEHSEAELLALAGVGPGVIRHLSDELTRLGWSWTARLREGRMEAGSAGPRRDPTSARSRTRSTSD